LRDVPASSTPRAERIEPQTSDAELVERLSRGDAWAKEALYRRYVGLVWSTALRLLGNRSDAEDVVQDTFADALRDLPRLGNVEALSGWLLQVAVHQAHRRFRRRSLLRRFGLDRQADDASLASLAHPGASAEVHADLARIDRALADLSAGERFAWTLRYVGGHSLIEVASACRCSLPTVKRRLAKANQRVARHRLGGVAE
jgi:RNA polymerase sigma-70 factor (ECF subfamily)